MRKFMVVCAALSLLSACATPNGTATGNGTTTGTGSSGTGTSAGANAGASGNATATKQAYIQALTCIKGKSTSADQRAAIDANIAAVNMVPDSTWAAVSASLSVSYNAWLQAIGGACS